MDDVPEGVAPSDNEDEVSRLDWKALLSEVVAPASPLVRVVVLCGPKF